MNMKDFRALTWAVVYTYGDDKKGFKVFGCDLKDIAIVHDHCKGKQTKISYRVARRTTESPSQAVKWWNTHQKNTAQRGEDTRVPNSLETRTSTKSRIVT